ncbi:ABC transporter substrate-binding protein [Citricoccus parietis]|uniref:ABC transporter substrate-binding protein n=1 Tax=Citricoccus parietis TaxID=592307 RepID=A0ABV6F0T4_9MICC
MRRRTRAFATSGLVLVGLLAGCASGSEPSTGSGTSGEGESQQGQAGLASITLGIFPGATFAGLEVAKDEGIFEKHGLDVQTSMSQGGAELLPAVMTRSIDVAVGNPVSVMQAFSKGLDVTIIAGYGKDGPANNDTSAVVAMPDEGIQSAKDLVGKTVAVNSLQGALELGIRESVRLDGGDPNGVNFIELAFPDMPGQLESGTVDAICVGQPFMGAVLENGGEVVLESQKESGTGDTILVTFSSDAFVEENPELVDSFRAAWSEALDYAQENPDLVRAEIPDFIGMDPELAADLPLEGVSAELSMDGLQAYADLMVQYGVVDELPNLDELTDQ